MEFSAILDTLCRTGTCTVCLMSLKDSVTRILAWSNKTQFVELACPHCQAKHLLQIDLVGLPTPEAAPVVYVPPIGSDELLDLHSFLASHQGDFRSLFATPSEA